MQEEILWELLGNLLKEKQCTVLCSFLPPDYLECCCNGWCSSNHLEHEEMLKETERAYLGPWQSNLCHKSLLFWIFFCFMQPYLMQMNKVPLFMFLSDRPPYNSHLISRPPPAASIHFGTPVSLWTNSFTPQTFFSNAPSLPRLELVFSCHISSFTFSLFTWCRRSKCGEESDTLSLSTVTTSFPVIQ